MHVRGENRACVPAFENAQIGAVDVDGVVVHALIEAVFRADHSFTAGEMGGVGMEGEAPGIVMAAATNAEPVQRDVFRHLRQQPHAESEMHGDVFDTGIVGMIEKKPRRGPRRHPQHQICVRLQIVAPAGNCQQFRREFRDFFRVERLVGLVVKHPAVGGEMNRGIVPIAGIVLGGKAQFAAVFDPVGFVGTHFPRPCFSGPDRSFSPATDAIGG